MLAQSQSNLFGGDKKEQALPQSGLLIGSEATGKDSESVKSQLGQLFGASSTENLAGLFGDPEKEGEKPN